MLLKSFKPGKFRPKCSACGIVFSLVISADDPPKVISSHIDVASKPETPIQPKTLTLETFPEIISDAPISSKVAPDLDQTIIAEPAHSLTANSSFKTHGNLDQTLIVEPNAVRVMASHAPPKTSFSSPANAPLARPVQVANLIPASARPSPVLSKASVDPKQSSTIPTPERLGGYRIVRVLGEGGMGAVYLAKQISLDRSVALKTIQPQWAASPRVIARFIREAYAAAQLSHHNVVQIYDLGEDAGINFFSMELVGGGSLEDLLKQKGVLPPKTASMLILQAARGLKFAHDHGMVHRDIKPANLMLTNDGMLKVADLGLVKTPSMDDSVEQTSGEDQNLMLLSARTSVTFQGSTMGTPAYMSPEQADDASSVDNRADIYSLGCTFYALLTGRPPFVSNTIIEILSKHKVEKIPRPESIVNNVPGVLGDIIDKMTAKRPEDRYQDLQDTIYDIEVFLGLTDPEEAEYRAATYSGIGPTIAGDRTPSETTSIPVSQLFDKSKSPDLSGPNQSKLGQSTFSTNTEKKSSQDQRTVGFEPVRKLASANESELEALKKSAKDFASHPLRFVQQFVPILFVGLCLFLTFLFLFRSMTATVSFLILALSASCGAIITGHFNHRSPLAQRVKQLFKSNSILDWIYQILGCLFIAVAIYVLGIWAAFLVTGILGLGIGTGYFYLIEEPLRKSRLTSVREIEILLKQARLRGLDEDAVRNALLESSGPCNESLIASVLGYDAMRRLVQSHTCTTRKSPIQRWQRVTCFTDRVRDYYIQRIDVRLEEARKKTDQKILLKTERASLIASGISASEATRKATEAAEGLVEVASETKQALADINSGALTKEDADAKRARIKRMMLEARAGKPAKASFAKRSLQLALGQALGGKMRFVLGAFLLAGFSLWTQQNELFSTQTFEQVRNVGAAASETEGSTIDKANAALRSTAELGKSLFRTDTKPLRLPIIGGLFQNFTPAFAGLLLIFSSFAGGWLLSLTMLPAVGLMLIGPSVGIPGLGEWVSPQTIAIILGSIVATIGYWLTPCR